MVWFGLNTLFIGGFKKKKGRGDIKIVSEKDFREQRENNFSGDYQTFEF